MEYTEDDKETEIKDEGAEGNDDEDGWLYTHSDRGTITDFDPQTVTVC